MSIAIDFSSILSHAESIMCICEIRVIWRLAFVPTEPTLTQRKSSNNSAPHSENQQMVAKERREPHSWKVGCLQNSWANFDRSPLDGTHTETILHPFPDSGRCLKTQHHRCVRLDLCMIHQAHSQYYAATKNDQIHLTWSASEFQIVTRHASGNLQCLHFPLLIHAPCNNAFQMQTNGNIISNHVQ